MFLRNHRIIVRMAIGFGILLILLIFLTTMGIMSLWRTQKGLMTITRSCNIKVQLSQDMRFLARHEAVIVRNILLLNETIDKEYELKRIEKERLEYAEMQHRLMDMVQEDKEKDIMKRIIEGRNITIPLWDKVIQIGMAQKQEEGIQVLIKEVRPVQWKWLDSLDEMVNLQKEMAENSAKDAFHAYTRTRTVSIIGGILAIIIGLFFAIIITSSITRPLSDLVKKIDLGIVGNSKNLICLSKKIIIVPPMIKFIIYMHKREQYERYFKLLRYH